MKSINISFLFLFFALAITGIFSSCSDDENLPNNGKPLISYIRVTNPEASDSLIVTAGQGSMIAVMGQNLQDVHELWVNDRKASLNPNFVTNTSILTRVPSRIPSTINNQMKLIFADGDSLIHEFTVDISEPEIHYMVSEYVNTGEVATIRGNFFYEPTVTFTGGVTGEIKLLEDDRIEVIVPEGVEPGPVTVTTNFGVVVSDFWFRDNRNIIAGFEETDFSGWWQGKDFIVDSDPNITPVNNKFIRINDVKAPWSWLEFWVGDGGTILEATKNIPEEAFSKPKDYNIKFEINTLSPLSGAEVRMYMGNSSAFNADRQDIYYVWKPNVDTNGTWQTISIPFEDFLEANTNLSYNPDGYQVSFYFSSPVETTLNFGMDNIRVVPNE